MARKDTTVIISAEGRDKGKKFFIKEMPASQAIRWADRAILALTHAGVQLPNNFRDMGMAGMAIMGLQALMGLNYMEAEPLLDELMTCVQIVPSERAAPRPIIVDDDIEEPFTIMYLRAEAFLLHVGFTMAEVQSMWTSARTTSADSKATETSPAT